MKTAQENKIGFFLYKAKTKNGIEFDPNDNIWSHNDISRQYQFNFHTLHISNNCLYGLKRVFVWYLENKSFTHSANMFHGLKKLLEYLYEQSKKNITTLTSTHLIESSD